MLDWPAPPSRVGRCGQIEHCCFLSFRGVRTCSIGPHLPALFWSERVFGQCEEGGDHLSRRFLSEKTKMLNRIPSVGASCDIQYSPLGAGKSWTQSWRACFWSVRRGGRSFIPEISFRDDGNVESHSVRGGIIRYSIFSPWGRFARFAMPGAVHENNR